VISQIPTALQLIPAEVEAGGPADLAGGPTSTSRKRSEILDDLLPRNIAVQVFRALLENRLEQGARMSAMDNATRNAGDMINKLTIKYNRSARRRSPRN
jgi:F-type H+-transporting ATPase subunit gamma